MQNRWLFCLWLLVLTGLFEDLTAQTFAFRNITEKDGLPSTYLYDIAQDDEGYVWLTGESGLSRYNGQQHDIPKIAEQIEDEIIRFFKGAEKQLWMQDLAGRVMMMENDVLKVFDEIAPSLIYRYTSVFCHPNGDTWIATIDDVFLYKNAQDTLLSLGIDNKNDKLTCVKAFSLQDDGSLLLLLDKGYYKFENDQVSYHLHKNRRLGASINFGFNYRGKQYLAIKDSIFYFDKNEEHWIPAFQELHEYLEKGILNSLEDSDGDLWLSTKSGILLITQDSLGQMDIKHLFEGMVMGSMMEDKEGNIWLVTGQNGIYVLPSKKIIIFKKDGLDQPLRFIKKTQPNHVVLGFDNNEFKIIDQDFKLLREQKLYVQNYRLYDYQQNDIGQHYFITSGGVIILDKKFRQIRQSSEWSLKQGAFSPDGTFWLAGGEYFGRLNDLSHTQNFLRKRCYSLLPVTNEKIWVGTIEGLFLYEKEVCRKMENPVLQHDIRDIKLLDSGALLLATQKNGLIYYHPDQDSLLYHFSVGTGLSSNHCSKVLVDEKYFWLATKKGVNRIDRKDYSVMVIGKEQGLPSTEVNDIFGSQHQLLIATNRGLAAFDRDINFVRTPPTPRIVTIKINEKDTSLQTEYKLDYLNNNIKIEFDAITFRNASEVLYEYKMDGLDEEWVRSPISVAQYPSLPPGEFTFQVRSQTINSQWSDIQSIKFSIDRPFWRSGWFSVLLFFAALLFGYLIFSEVNRRKSVIRDMRASQLTALRAQMNPHFIFNSLNSIQEFIVNKDARLANKYLSQFARLMRNVLNSSDKNHISLGKELESLKLYLSLETLRLGDSFEYVFEVDESLDKDTVYLPSMLIQPFVENAIKHGLMHHKGVKKLYLRFYNKEGILICEIEDNGVGRKRSRAIQKMNPRVYASKATGLIKERVNLFNAISNNTLNVAIIDLEDHQAPSGTKVILTIALNYKEF